MAGVRAGTKDLRDITRRFKPGYHLRSDGKAKFIVMGPDGEPVRQADGRHLGLPNSPHVSAIPDHIRRLQNAGVIDTGERVVREHTRLAPLHHEDVDHSNSHASNQLRSLITEHLSAFKTPEVEQAVSYWTGVDRRTVASSLTKLRRGGNLTPEERRPLEELISYMETEDDPIKGVWGLIRQAKGLPEQAEEILPEPVQEPIQEPKEEKKVEPLAAMAAASGGTVEEMVGNFISDLTERIDKMYEEINKLEELKATLETQYPTIKIEADDDEPAEETPATTGRAVPREATTSRVDITNGSVSRSSIGTTRKSPVAVSDEQIMELLDKGGEWTLNELCAAVGATNPTVTRRVRELIEKGDAVVVEPSKMGHGGRKPGTYGSSKFYQRTT